MAAILRSLWLGNFQVQTPHSGAHGIMESNMEACKLLSVCVASFTLGQIPLLLSKTWWSLKDSMFKAGGA